MRQQGELESQVMDVIWSSEEPITSQQVLDSVNGAGNELALTTILTVLSRLVDKGLIVRESSGGRNLKFAAVESRELHSANLMLKLLDDSQNPALTFAQFTSALSPKQLEALRKSIEQ